MPSSDKILEPIEGLIRQGWEGQAPPPAKALFRWSWENEDELDDDDVRTVVTVLGDRRFDEVDWKAFSAPGTLWFHFLTVEAVVYYTGAALLCQVQHLLPNRESWRGSHWLRDNLSNVLMAFDEDARGCAFSREQILALLTLYRTILGASEFEGYEPDRHEIPRLLEVLERWDTSHAEPGSRLPVSGTREGSDVPLPPLDGRRIDEILDEMFGPRQDEHSGDTPG